MPLTAKGEKILSALEKEYGEKKGKSVLYAGKNKGTFTGIDSVVQHCDAVKCDAEMKCDATFRGYTYKRIGEAKIIEGIGPDGGRWRAEFPRGGGVSRTFNSSREAIEHAEAEQEGYGDANEESFEPVFHSDGMTHAGKLGYIARHITNLEKRLRRMM